MPSIRRLPAIFKALFITAAFHLIASNYYANAINSCPADSQIQPCKCSQQTGQLQIWCSHSDLSKLAESIKMLGRHVHEVIDELIIENNLLPSLPGQIFSSVKVSRLMLRNNGLQQIALNWLAGLEPVLQEIYMVEPDLRNFPDDSLFTLPKLEALTLSLGSVTKMPAIFGLPRLRYVQIEAPLMSEILVDNFQGLPFLEQLHITSASKLRQLESEFLHDLPKLSILNFTQSGLSSIHARALTRLPLLTELFLTGNKFKNARLVGMAIRDMPNLATVRIDGNLIEKLEDASFVDMPSVRNLDLSRNKITYIYRAAFHRLPSLRSLDLADNQIRTIHPDSFLPPMESNLEEIRLANNRLEHSRLIRLLLDMLPRLRLLDLSGNQLPDISFGTVQGHMHLEILHLEHNAIQRIDKEAFIGLPSLRELKLQNNSISNYVRVPFWNLPALKGLDISRNKFDHLDQMITSGLPSLRRLDVSWNSLRTVDPMTFVITPNLEHVNLSHNAVDVLVPSTFSHLQKLFDLDISHNNFSQMVSGLPKSIEYLYMSHNQIPMIASSAFTDLQLPSLKLLDLSGNRIHHILPESFNSLCTLRTLYLNGNMLQKVDQPTLAGLSQLRTLNLSNNKLIIISKDSFKQMKHLTELNLSDNRLEMIGAELLSQNSELRKLDLSKNRLLEPFHANFSSNRKIEELNLSYNSLTEFPTVITGMRSIRILDLSGNQIKSLPSNALSTMSSLEELKLNDNKLQLISEGIFDKSLSLTDLHLENNEIERITPNAIKALPNLATINLSGNKLSTIPTSAFNNLPSLRLVELHTNQITGLANEAFTGCHSLLMLNVSHNFISDINKCGFRKIRSLEALDISHNRIAEIPADGFMNDMNFLVMLKADNNRLCDIEGSPFESMSRLRVLSLRDNKMTSLSESTFRKLRSSFMYLDIEGNPIRCSCNMLWLHEWLQNEDTNFPGPRCSDGILLKDHIISRINCEESVTEIVPGCESKLSKSSMSPLPSSTLQPTKPTPNPSITFKPNKHVIAATNRTNEKPVGKPHILPLPEESDYFDPKYVEYNETTSPKISANAHQGTIPPEVLSHYIPGDTPTIYAGMRPRGNTTMKDSIVPSTTPQTSVTPPKTTPNSNESGFTFFGVPIPQLNLNNFWSNGKYKDKSGKSRSEASDIEHATMRTANGPSMPEMVDGFVPMLPGIGGFSPIVVNESSPVISPAREEFQNPYVNRSWYRPIGSNSIPGHAIVSKVALSVPRNETVNMEQLLNDFNTALQNNVATSSSATVPRDSLFESSTNEAVPVTKKLLVADVENVVNRRTTEKDPLLFEINNTGNKSYFSKEHRPGNLNGLPKNKGSNRQVEDPYVTMKNYAKSDDRSGNKFNPSPLSGFLAPGGQLLAASPSLSSTGRTNQAKIQLVSGPSPHSEDDIQSSHLRLAKSSFQSSTTEISYISTSEMSSASIVSSTFNKAATKYTENSSFNWYFENYNQTNIEPYIGKPIQLSASTSSANQYSLPLHLVLILLVYF